MRAMRPGWAGWGLYFTASCPARRCSLEFYGFLPFGSQFKKPFFGLFFIIDSRWFDLRGALPKFSILPQARSFQLME